MKIAIIGCGNMGSAILNGIVEGRVFKKTDIFICDKNSKLEKKTKLKFKGVKSGSVSLVTKKSDIIILSVKPQDVKVVLEEIRDDLKGKTLVSICAGIKISFIKGILGRWTEVIRVMPNMPAVINYGVSAISLPRRITVQKKRIIGKIFESFGSVYEVKESEMDAITAVSGSGPAYFFYILEALRKVSCDIGLKKNLARELVLDTALGACLLAMSSKFSLDELIKKVASKGGTTEAALRSFNESNLDKAFIKGVKKAKRRSEELSRSF